MDQSFSVNLKVDQGNVTSVYQEPPHGSHRPTALQTRTKVNFWTVLATVLSHGSAGLLDFYFLLFHPLTGSSFGWFLVNGPHLLALQYVVLQVLHQLGVIVFVEQEVLLLPGQRCHGGV